MHTAGEYDVKWFGAVGDNATDDYAAIQACIDLAELLAGGDVVLSKGGYAVSAGLVIDTPLTRLKGVGKRYCSLRALSANITVVTVAAARCGVEGISIFNQNLASSQNGLIYMGPGSVQCVAQDLDLVGGWNAILVGSGCFNTTFRDIVARATNGGQIVDIYGQFITFEDCVFDHDWPVFVPSSSNFKGARANGTAYSVGDVLTVSGVYLQCIEAGTTGGSVPGLAWYETDIIDGTIKWRLANVQSSSAVRINTGSARVRIVNCDHTGAFDRGIHVADTLAGADPYEVMLSRCESSGIVSNAVVIDAGNRVTIEGCEFNAPVGNAATKAGILTTGGFAGDLSVIGCRIASGFDRGIWIGGGTGTNIHACHIFATTGIRAEGGVQKITIMGNNFSSATWGTCATAVLMAGSNNNYVIRGNIGTNGGSTINDSGGGTNRDVGGNV